MAALAAVHDKQEFEVWPDNWQAFSLFARMTTQWRVGMGGPTGLCYDVLLALMDRMHLSEEEHDQLFEDILVMERAALDVI